MKTPKRIFFMVLIASAFALSNCSKDSDPVTDTDTSPVSEVEEKEGEIAPASQSLWVAPGGSDIATNPGTQSQPLATIQEAIKRAVPGTAIILKDGTYQLATQIEFTKSGLPGKPIVLRAANKGKAIITGANSSGIPIVPANVGSSRARKGLINIENQKFITIDGLVVQKSQRFGIAMLNTTNSSPGSANIEVLNCLVEDTYACGIIAARSANIVVRGNVVQRACLDPDVNVRISECISMASVKTFEVSGNTVRDRIFPGAEPPRGGEGIDAKNACSNGKIFNNTVYNLDKVGIYVDAYADVLDDVQVYNNIVYATRGGITTAVEGTAEVSGPTDVKVGTLKNVQIFNNLIKDVTGIGIRIAGYLEDGPQQNISVFQNTVVRASAGLLLEGDNALNSNIVVKNNIFANSTNFQMRKTGNFNYRVENNLIAGNNNSGAFIPPGTINVPNVLFVGADNFALQPSSPARDKALEAAFMAETDIVGTSRNISGSPDLGAYEYKP